MMYYISNFVSEQQYFICCWIFINEQRTDLNWRCVSLRSTVELAVILEIGVYTNFIANEIDTLIKVMTSLFGESRVAVGSPTHVECKQGNCLRDLETQYICLYCILIAF
jgi:hypothetical protein